MMDLTVGAARFDYGPSRCTLRCRAVCSEAAMEDQKQETSPSFEHVSVDGQQRHGLAMCGFLENRRERGGEEGGGGGGSPL